MKKKLLAIILILLASTLACLSETVGSVEVLATQMPTVTVEVLATNKLLAAPTNIPATLFVKDKYHIRELPKSGGKTVGFVDGQTVILLDTASNGWMYIELDGIRGWISPLAIEELK